MNFIYLLNEFKDSKEKKPLNIVFKNINIELFDISSIKIEEKREITEEDKKIAEKLWDEFVFALTETKEQDLKERAISQFSDDQRFEYSSEEYEEKIEKFQEYADEMAKRQANLSAKSFFSETNTNSHFLGIATELLDRFKTDTNIAENVAGRLNEIFNFFLNTKQYGGCLKCLSLKKKAEEQDPSFKVCVGRRGKDKLFY